ncbi:hypothetical protein R3X25_01895 [Lutibacter sp. TH_r2]|uniref:hypothetical protein n=1 Tax=Lutibacter sp. TH_r2 TaxID=3082083 RepID=UPI0029554663|nr:hypothetical protein [Lutibacter sp. TH_r2]MDV7186019.1 hypothetical protein [Lutibacter sp. TH_r2]
MLKKFLYLILVPFFISSCSYFQNQTNKKNTIHEVDTLVDFTSVDAFPLFPNCTEIPSREKQQICFQMEMSQHIYASLKKHQLNALELVNDTVLVKLKVNAEGKTTLSNVEISEDTKNKFPQFDSILRVSISHIPILKPAIKRDMPVTTQFVLPIILKN